MRRPSRRSGCWWTALSHGAEAIDDLAFPDDRLKLLFVCAHPEVDRGMHTPLMLQVVLGLDAATIASAFLTSPAAMGQRLSRAKARIRDAGIAFEIPDRRALPARLDAVLDAIYAAYGTGWDDVAGSDPRRGGLAQEAVWLVRTLLQLLPDEPEARGLLALMLYCEARRPARRAATATTCRCRSRMLRLWSAPMLEEAERELTAAAAAAASRAIPARSRAAVGARRRRAARPDGLGAIAVLYEGWCARRRPSARSSAARRRLPKRRVRRRDSTPSIGSTRPRSRATSRIGPCVRTSCAVAGRVDEALGAYDRAIGLTEDAATRQFLLRRRAEAEASAKGVASDYTRLAYRCPHAD